MVDYCQIKESTSTILTLKVTLATIVVLKLYYRTEALTTKVVFGLLYQNVNLDDTGPSTSKPSKHCKG